MFVKCIFLLQKFLGIFKFKCSDVTTFMTRACSETEETAGRQLKAFDAVASSTGKPIERWVKILVAQCGAGLTATCRLIIV